MKRIFHSAVTAYLILALGLVGALVRTQQVNGDGHARDTQARHALCEYTRSSWDERDAIVKQLTEHAAPLPQGLDIGLTGTALKTLIARGNARKDRERAALLRLQGPKPKC